MRDEMSIDAIDFVCNDPDGPDGTDYWEKRIIPFLVPINGEVKEAAAEERRAKKAGRDGLLF